MVMGYALGRKLQSRHRPNLSGRFQPDDEVIVYDQETITIP